MCVCAHAHARVCTYVHYHFMFKGWDLVSSLYSGVPVLETIFIFFYYFFLERIFKSHIAIVLTLTVFHSQISIQSYVLSDLQRSERKFSDLTFTGPN